MFVFGTADDVFAMAVRIEENGRAFYEGAAAKAESEGVKALFTDLADMEAGHITLFKALRGDLAESIANAPWDPEGLAESYLQATADTHIFGSVEAAKRLEGIKTADEALDVALQFEKDSVTFFLGMKDTLPDAGGKEDVDKLIQQEKDHILMIAKAKKQLAETGSVSIAKAEETPGFLDKQGRPKTF